jgi:hypothetical protein
LAVLQPFFEPGLAHRDLAPDGDFGGAERGGGFGGRKTFDFAQDEGGAFAFGEGFEAFVDEAAAFVAFEVDFGGRRGFDGQTVAAGRRLRRAS